MISFISGLFIAFLTIAYLFTCMFLIIIVLMQEGKGGGISGMVSGTSPLSDTLGAHDAEHTLRNWTKYSAIGFMVLAVLLTILGPRLISGNRSDLINDLPAAPPPAVATTQTGADEAAAPAQATAPQTGTTQSGAPVTTGTN